MSTHDHKQTKRRGDTEQGQEQQASLFWEGTTETTCTETILGYQAILSATWRNFMIPYGVSLLSPMYLTYKWNSKPSITEMSWYENCKPMLCSNYLARINSSAKRIKLFLYTNWTELLGRMIFCFSKHWNITTEQPYFTSKRQYRVGILK